jgi:uncharacterized protein YyaL (SSP411 family)
MLLALDLFVGPTKEIVVVGNPHSPDTSAVLAAIRRQFFPNKVVACRALGETCKGPLDPLFEGKPLTGPEPGLFVCENFACQQPVFGREGALESLESLGR